MDLQHAREDLLRNSDVQHLIAERAYLISQNRGFEDGHQIEDWFQAENEVLDYLLRDHEAVNAEAPAARALALTDSAIYEEPVAAPIASDAISAEPGNAVETPAKKQTATKRATKSETPKAKSAASKTVESKSVKTSAPKLKPTLRKASKKPTATNPSSGVGD